MGSRAIFARGFILFTFVMTALVVGFAAAAARAQSGQASPRGVHKLRNASPPPGYAPPTVVSLRLGRAGSNVVYWVKATENRYDAYACPTRLTITARTPGQDKQILDYKSCDWLQYAMPGGDESAVITVWETGSAIMTRVFRLSPDRAKLTLERGTHLPPEFTLDRILLNVGWVPVDGRCCTGERTEIWDWTGESYRLVATVPFDQRYSALAKPEHEGKP